VLPQTYQKLEYLVSVIMSISGGGLMAREYNATGPAIGITTFKIKVGDKS